MAPDRSHIKRARCALFVVVLSLCPPRPAPCGPTSGSPDTSSCWPILVVADTRGRSALEGTVQLWRIESQPGDSVQWLMGAGLPSRIANGRWEIVGLTTGHYLAYATGFHSKRPLAGWKPPAEPHEVGVGMDPWKRPDQGRLYSAWAQWEIRNATCADSLILEVKPGPWLTLDGEKRFEPARLPAPYRLRPNTSDVPRWEPYR